MEGEAKRTEAMGLACRERQRYLSTGRKASSRVALGPRLGLDWERDLGSGAKGTRFGERAPQVDPAQATLGAKGAPPRHPLPPILGQPELPTSTDFESRSPALAH
jgi:hypothetical protein